MTESMKSNVLKLNNGFKLSFIVIPLPTHRKIKGTMNDERKRTTGDNLGIEFNMFARS